MKKYQQEGGKKLQGHAYIEICRKVGSNLGQHQHSQERSQALGL